MPYYQYIKSVSRALRMLSLVGNASEGLSLQEIALPLELPKQTAHGIIRTLIHEGFLEKSGSPVRYRLGPMMDSLRDRQAHWNRVFLTRATSVAIRLARRMDAEVAINQFVAGEVINRLRIPVGTSGFLEHHYGWRIAPYGTAVLFQAFMTDSELQDYRARHPLDESSRKYWGSLRLLDRFLRQARKEGYLAFAKGSLFRTAAIVFKGSNSAVAMISLIKPLAEMTGKEPRVCVDMVRQAAKELSVGPVSAGETVGCRLPAGARPS